MSDEEKPLDLRDKLALEILNGLLSGDVNIYSQTSGKMKSASQIIHDYYSAGHESDMKIARERAEKLIRTAYMMADVMRRVRLTAFE